MTLECRRDGRQASSGNHSPPSSAKVALGLHPTLTACDFVATGRGGAWSTLQSAEPQNLLFAQQAQSPVRVRWGGADEAQTERSVHV